MVSTYVAVLEVEDSGILFEGGLDQPPHNGKYRE